MVNSDQHVNLIFGLKSEICEEHAGDEGPAEDSSSDVHEVQFGKKSGHCYIYIIIYAIFGKKTPKQLNFKDKYAL